MLVRGVGALAIMLSLTPGALAGGHSGIVNRVSCAVVRYYVAKYSASAAEMWARGHGATGAGIEAARTRVTDTPSALAAARARARSAAASSRASRRPGGFCPAPAENFVKMLMGVTVSSGA